MLSAPPKVNPVNHIRVTQSLQGIAIPLVFGTARAPGLQVFSADLRATPESTSGKAKGGKSGLYAYTATFIAALCQGPILGINQVWDQSGALPATPQGVTFNILAAPSTPPGAATISGGSLPSRTLYLKWTYTDANGESAGSAESSISVPANNLLQVASPPTHLPATGWNLYIGTSSGSEQLATATPIAIGNAYTEPATGYVTQAIVCPPQPIVTAPAPSNGGNVIQDLGVGNGGGPTPTFTRLPVV